MKELNVTTLLYNLPNHKGRTAILPRYDRNMGGVEAHVWNIYYYITRYRELSTIEYKQVRVHGYRIWIRYTQYGLLCIIIGYGYPISD